MFTVAIKTEMKKYIMVYMTMINATLALFNCMINVSSYITCSRTPQVSLKGIFHPESYCFIDLVDNTSLTYYHWFNRFFLSFLHFLSNIQEVNTNIIVWYKITLITAFKWTATNSKIIHLQCCNTFSIKQYTTEPRGLFCLPM